MKLTCKIGTFYFDDVQSRVEYVDHKDGRGKVLTAVDNDVPVSHMQIVRDTVMDKVLNNPRGSRPLRTTRDVYAYARTAINGPASKTTFRFIPAPGVWIKQGLKQTMGRQHRNVPRVA